MCFRIMKIEKSLFPCHIFYKNYIFDVFMIFTVHQQVQTICEILGKCRGMFSCGLDPPFSFRCFKCFFLKQLLLKVP